MEERLLLVLPSVVTVTSGLRLAIWSCVLLMDSGHGGNAYSGAGGNTNGGNV